MVCYHDPKDHDLIETPKSSEAIALRMFLQWLMDASAGEGGLGGSKGKLLDRATYSESEKQ